jgi:alkylation response protein AidB-like acyl-CoA dehydrogenase
VISFQLSEEQEVAREALRGFARDAMRKIARACDEESKIPEEFLAQVAELGLVSTQIPEAFGGGGEPRSPVTHALVLEELAWGDPALALAALAPAGFAHAILDQGSEEQRQRLLPAFCEAGYRAAALAVNEPAAGFDPRRPRTQASRRGDRYRLSGRKCLVPMADRASHFLVLASCDGAPEAFLVARDAPGLSLSAPEKTLGLRALPTRGLELDGVEVGLEDRLGGAAGCDVQRLLDRSRAALAAVMVGLARAVLEYAIPYAKERHAFGEAIARKQAIAFRLADMHVETEASRWLTWKAASQLERGVDATRAAHLAQRYAAEQCLWIADQGLQVLGGHGYIREHPVEMWYRGARTLGVLEGMLSV